MNRTDRLLAIVLELQAHGWRRAEDLAATFEVSKRTIYRDVLALGEAGVPLVAEPGRGYRLPDGYFLPPLRFSVEEAVMLLLGSDVVAQAFDAGLSDQHAVERVGVVPWQPASFLRLRYAGGREVHVGPAREAVLQVPGRFAVADQHELVHQALRVEWGHAGRIRRERAQIL